MCLILFAWQAHPDYALVFASNRDEDHERPAAPAGFWSDEPAIFGGRDLRKGGTWLGVSRAGRLAAVTSYRERPGVKNAPRSRGELAARFLAGTDRPRDYLAAVSGAAAGYAAYNLLVADRDRMWYGSNRGGAPQEVVPGVHGLSNHLLDTPWPKVAGGKARVSRLLSASEPQMVEGLFEMLSDRATAPDAELPDTGVGTQRERELSPMFIAAERYGTRASTVILIGRDGAVRFVERSFGPHGVPTGATDREFRFEPAPAAAS